MLKREEQPIYQEWMNKLETAFNELVASSEHRQRSLESLMDFIESATNELMWLNEKEETEIARDWSSKGLRILEIEEYRKVFIGSTDQKLQMF